MYNNTFYPLRKIVSHLVPIKQLQDKPPLGATLIYQSETAKALNFHSLPLHITSLDVLKTQPFYGDFLPTHDNLIFPGPGMNELPVANSFPPFANSNSFLSIYAKTDTTTNLNLSRKLSLKYLITIDNDSFIKAHKRKPMIGGICFKGFPYAHFAINDNGENISNFGLPREVRVTCANIPDNTYKERFTNFIDEEVTSVDQQIISHSGFHYVCCDPTFATHIILELSDLPYFTSQYSLNTDKKIDEQNFYGIIIPYLYMFEYEERTRYDKNVPSGFLGARKNGFEPAHENVEWSLLNVDPNGSLEYFDFTAASIFGQQRTYELNSAGSEQEFDFSDLAQFIKHPPKPKNKKGKTKKYHECFISKLLKKDDSIVLYFEQGEEFDRCISGIRMLMPFVPKEDFKKDVERLKQLTSLFFPEYLEQLLADISNASEQTIEKLIEFLFRIPKVVKFCSKTRIRIFELDPVGGISPVNVKLDDRYSTLLADVTVDTLSELLLSYSFDGIKFKKVSTAKYFAIEFTNKSEEEGQIVVRSLKYIQSAHVSLTSRAARTQRVKNLQFRIIGKGIADDYSRLGEEGFNFCIERQTAGKRGDVLFKANSLLDLLHNGVGKIFSNSRRRSVEFEKVQSNAQVKKVMNEANDDFEKRYSEVRQDGWRRSETGDGIDDFVDNEFDWDGNKRPKAFESFSTAENRTHTQHLFPDTNDYVKIKDWFDSLSSAFGVNALIQPRDEKKLDDNFERFWKGLSAPRVRGLRQMTISPAAFLEFASLGSFLQTGNIADLLTAIDAHQNPGLITLAGAVNSSVGVNAGLSAVVVSVGESVSIGFNPLPVINHSSSIGSQGSITKNALHTPYSYAQFLNSGYDESNIYSRLKESEYKRMITRKDVPGTEKQRIKGAEIMWQDELVDIITGSIPLNFDLPATASKMYFRTSDDALRVRFGNSVGRSMSVDFWFDINEEIITDDY